VNCAPEYRAGLCRLTLARVRTLHCADTVLGNVDPCLVDAIERASAVSWIPTQPLDALNHALLTVVEEDGYIDFWSEHSTATSASPLLGSLAGAAMRIFGANNPRGFLKWIGRAWDLTARNLGTLLTQERERDVLVVLQGVPASNRVNTVPLSLHGSILGLVTTTGHTPRIDADTEHFEADGIVKYAVRW